MNITHYLGGAWTLVANAYHDYWTALLQPHLLHPGFAVLLPVLIYLALLWGNRQVTIRHSTLAPHKGLRSWSTLSLAAYASLILCVVHINIAMMSPVVPQASVQHLKQTRNVCVANDFSGSMDAILNDGAKELAEDQQRAAKDPASLIIDSGTNDKLLAPAGATAVDPSKPMNRLQAAQMATRYFIRNRMTDDPSNTDRFCMMRFDDDLYLMAPLTDDKIVLTLRTAQIANTSGGTNFVVALQKAYEYFVQNTSDNSTRVLIMNTDGFDAIDPQNRADFIQRYKDAHIKFYVIGLGDGWKEGNQLDLQKFADELHAADPTSGIVFRASNPGQMKAAMEKINELEQAQEVYETLDLNRDVDYAFILGAIGFALLFFGCVTVAGRVP